MHPDNLCVSEWNLLEDNRLPVGLVGAAETAAPPTVSVRRSIGFRSLHDDRSIESGRNFLCLFFTDF